MKSSDSGMLSSSTWAAYTDSDVLSDSYSPLFASNCDRASRGRITKKLMSITKGRNEKPNKVVLTPKRATFVASA